jgi:hypothetical protein
MCSLEPSIIAFEEFKCFSSHVLDVKLPTNYKEAMMSKNKLQWTEAMKSEMDSITKNNTWVYSNLRNVTINLGLGGILHSSIL